MAAPRFHRLKIAAVRPETEDAVALRFEVPDELAEAYAFTPGQYLTLRAMIDGDELVDLNIDDQAVPILLESVSGRINDPSDLVNLYVGTADGGLLPLSSIVTLREEGVATELNRQAQRRAIEVGIVLALLGVALVFAAIALVVF